MRKFKDLPHAQGNHMTYAGVGHRDLNGFTEPNTGEPIQNVMAWVAGELEKMGYSLNSGGAKGADAAFEFGVKDSGHKTIFRSTDASEETRAIAQELHPAHEKLQGHALDLFARNTNQIFGRNLDQIVDFVLCYTKDGCESHTTRTRDSGGTGQAIEMASRKGVPVFNMKNPDWFSRLKKLVVESGNVPDGMAFELPKKGNFPKVPASVYAFNPQPKQENKPKPAMNAKQIKALLKSARR